MSPARRWLESFVYAICTTIFFFLVIRKGMWWWLGSTYLMMGAYLLLLWRTLVGLRYFIYGAPQRYGVPVSQQPLFIRRVILEEERPWERS